VGADARSHQRCVEAQGRDDGPVKLQIHVDELAAALGSRSGRDRCVHHAQHRNRARLRDPEQETELRAAERARHREDHAVRALADVTPDVGQVRAGEIGLGSRGRRGPRQGVERQPVPEAVEDVPGLQPRPVSGLGADHQVFAVHQGVARALRQKRALPGDCHAAVVQLDRNGRHATDSVPRSRFSAPGGG
jgi:hypothetical protein